MAEDSTSIEGNSTGKRKLPDKNRWDQNYPYNVIYNDHFETPRIAYEDIAPLLDWLAEGVPRKEHRIYDPYYCNGQTVTLFRQLGFQGIINRKRDFYGDYAEMRIPEHDTFVTNPPYSDQHKIRCLDIAFSQFRRENGKRIPFLCLMPDYVAAREYFRSREAGDVCYIVPSKPYDYSHPEGTGKDIPPFSSLWFCGIGKDRMKEVQTFWNQLPWKHKDRRKPTLAMSLDDLKASGIIQTKKRCNPRQRKKRRQHAQKQPPPTEGSSKKQRIEPSLKTKKSTSQAVDDNQYKNAKRSKYRDGTGKRQRKRF